MNTRIIEHNSADYEKMIALRITELLLPIGVPPSYINKEMEKNDILIAAFENDEMIGCCVLTPNDTETIQLRQMTVRSDQRGKRIGAAIIEFAEQVAREHHFSVLMMHARDPVINFYKKSCYQIYGDQFFEVGMAHHKMMKRL